MNQALEIFKLIGSGLGILSFILLIVTPFRDHNKETWKKISDIINLSDIDLLCDGASIGVIHQEPYRKLSYLVEQIRKDWELTQFKGFSGKRIRKNLKYIESALDRFDQEVQVPLWNYHPNDTDNDSINKRLDKNFVYASSRTPADGDQKVHESMKIASQEIEIIIELYRKCQRSATKTPFEYLIKK